MSVQLARDLLARLLRELAVAIARRGALLGEVAKEADGRLPRRQRIVGEAVAEVLESEGQTDGELAAIGHRVGAVGEEALHLARRLQMALAIVGEEPARAIQGGVMPDAGERVEERPLAALGHARRIGGEERQAERGRRAPQPLVARFLRAAEVALQLGIDIAAAEDAGEPVEQRARRGGAAGLQRQRHGPVRARR